MSNLKTFGEFVAQKRCKSKYTLRETATQIKISPVYLCEIENGKKTNPNVEIMQKLIYVLHLNEEETALFYDLHAKANGIVSQDITEYITENGIVRKALRTAKDKPATDKDWQSFINKIK